jgi:hypothetical protein
MASLEDLLWQTMPLAGASTELKSLPSYTALPSLLSPDEIPISNLLALKKIAPSDDVTVAKPDITADDYYKPLDTAVWRWKHAGGSPSIIGDVYARSRSSKYKSYKVLDSIEFGLETADAKGALKANIRVTNPAGKQIELPLTKDFVACKFATNGGTILKDQTALWKLPARLDQGLVIALIYTLPASGDPAPMTAADAAALKDEFMPSGAAAVAAGADVHGQATANVSDARVLVILSFATCKQGDDFAPGSLVGAGRVYPHILVMASLPLAKIEATVRLNRPQKTTTEDDEVEPPADIATKSPIVYIAGDVNKQFDGADCCSGPINSVFFTDANEMSELWPMPGPPPPFWPHFFAYYLLEPFQIHGNRTFNMVSHLPANCTTREADGLITRYLAMGKGAYTKIKKLPYQGEFDNVHMAPKMVLHNVQKVTHVSETTRKEHDTTAVETDVDMGTLHLDDISMAPFCAHDCLHTHWRWGKDDTDAAQCGFDGMIPYAKPGKPLVPDNQTVQVWLSAPNQFTYTATVWAFPNQPVANGQWQVIFHHGSAYALDIVAFNLAYSAKIGVEALAGEPRFTAADGTVITAPQSWSLFYWRLRWETVIGADGKVALRERVQPVNPGAAWAL